MTTQRSLEKRLKSYETMIEQGNITPERLATYMSCSRRRKLN